MSRTAAAPTAHTYVPDVEDALILDFAAALEAAGAVYTGPGVTVDGQFVTDVSEGQTVTVRASDDVARLIRLGERRFHQILKAKFGLADR